MKVSESTGVEIIEVSKLYVKEAYDKKTIDLKTKIEEYSRKADEKQRDIDKLNIRIEADKKQLEELVKKLRAIFMKTKIIKKN